MVGFKELLCRLQIQEQMTKQHQTRVDVSENTAAVVCFLFFLVFGPLMYKKNLSGHGHRAL